MTFVKKVGPRFLSHPAQVIAFSFAAAITVGTLLLMLPIAREGGSSAPWYVALFQATSATCVTGLATVNVVDYFTTFGEVVLLALIQVGGFGIMTLASLVGILVFRKMGLRTRLTTAAQTNAAGLGDLGTMIKGIAKVTALWEAATALALGLRFYFGYDYSLGKAAYFGVFHSISAFNNAGFALYGDNLMGFVGDPFITFPIMAAIIAGGLGFPVWLGLRTIGVLPRKWSLHMKMTIYTTIFLLVMPVPFFAATEWNNPGSLGPLSWPTKWMACMFLAVTPRTAGFNTLDYGSLHEGSLMATDALMFIGGGSGGTAGGIKVTTFIVLFFTILAEVRGERHINVDDRRIGPRTVRQALTVALLAMGAVVAGSLIILELTAYSAGEVFFEAVSAFGTVGLTTGITSSLPVPAQLVLVLLMYTGRIGPITLVSSLALRSQPRAYNLPEGRPLIG